MIPAYYGQVTLICRLQARELGITVPLFGGDGWEAPELIEGLARRRHWMAVVIPPIFRRNRIHPKPNNSWRITKNVSSAVPDAMGALGYDSVLALVDSIQRAAPRTAQSFRDAIATLKDLDGATGIKPPLDEIRNARKPAGHHRN